jgi:HEAT repeat protein
MRRRACTESTSWNGSVGEPTTSEVADAIAALLSDSDDSVVEIAAWASGERPPASKSTIERLCEIATSHDDALCRESAVAALGALSDPAGLGAILSATEDKATVRRRAVIALAPFDGPEVDAALERATNDRDWQVRQAAEDLSP